MKLIKLLFYFFIVTSLSIFSVNATESGQETLKRLYSGNKDTQFPDGNGRRALDWQEGETTKEVFTLVNGEKQSDIAFWIDGAKNSDLKNKKNGDVFFAYVLGKKDHTSALVRAVTTRTDDITTFQFDVIKGQIDDDLFFDGESKIDFMTELTFPSNFYGKVALMTNYQTLPDYPPKANVPKTNNTSLPRNYTKDDSWIDIEFEVKQVFEDEWGTQHIINHLPISEGYYLAYVKGSSNATDKNWEAYCLIHSYYDWNLNNKAHLLILDNGQIDDDGDIYINELKLVLNKQKLPEDRKDFDNILYEKYKDTFLMLPVRTFTEISDDNRILAEYLPSHLLYSPEDYTWDSARLRLVENGNETPKPYIDNDFNSEGTISKFFRDVNKNKIPDDKRIPILFIHGWQGELNNAFEMLHEYSWDTNGDIEDRPSSGEAYWRNLLTYMYRDHYDQFAKYKPYIYHYPTYKHISQQISPVLLDDLEKSGDDIIRNGIKNNNLIIIAHSMGTLISRSLMEEFGYLSHVKRFISLAGVHHGSPGAIRTLVDTSFFAGKDLYTPGACDLMPDNYDGFIDSAIKADIQRDTIEAKELLEQREACGNVFAQDSENESNEIEYDLNKESFDLFYLKKEKLGVLEVFDNYYVRRKFAVPFFSNPWLLNLNKDHYDKYKEITKDKYYFYAGYIIVTKLS